MSAVKATLIVPIHNTPKVELDACLASLGNQTISTGDYEVILVDDGSQEECRKQVVGYAEERPNFKALLLSRNEGVSHARNLGMAHANGEYVGFVDADDEVSPFFLEGALRLAEETDADVIVGTLCTASSADTADWTDSLGKVVTYSGTAELERATAALISLPSCRPTGLTGNFPDVHAGPCARLYRRSALDGHLFDETLTVGEDMLFNIEVINDVDSICTTDTIWYKYNQNDYSATHSYSLESITKRIHQLDKLIAKTKDYGFLVQQAVACRVMVTTQTIAKNILLGNVKGMKSINDKLHAINCLMNEPSIAQSSRNIEINSSMPASTRIVIGICRHSSLTALRNANDS